MGFDEEKKIFFFNAICHRFIWNPMMNVFDAFYQFSSSFRQDLFSIQMKVILLFLLIINGFHGAIVDVDHPFLSSLIKLIFKSSQFQLADCSSNFILKSNSSVYEKNKPIEGERMLMSVKQFFLFVCFSVTFESKSFDRTFRDLILYVEDHQGHFVGEWKSDDSQLISLSNRAIVDISQRSQTQVQALWYPESDLIGDVSIK